jgi:uncharacterized membrane protein (UPF0127 family)
LNKIVAAVLLILIAGTLCAGYVLLKPAGATRIMFGGVMLTVEIAATSADQEKGLSDRNSMAPDHGMLFVFDSEGMWGFWMKEMRFSLDIIWFNSQKRAVFIEQELPPCAPQNCPILTPPVKAMFVLEVNAGFVKAHNIAIGDSFSYLD